MTFGIVAVAVVFCLVLMVFFVAARFVIAGDELPSEIAIAEATSASSEQSINDINGDNIRRYSKDELFRIRSLPLSNKKPDCLGKTGAYGCWAISKKTNNDLVDDDKNSKDNSGDKRRPGDPRERLRKESEGIVLSPQRRSFTSGCFVVSGHPGSGRLRPDSPLDQKSDIGSRENSRRIGSGRILSRDIAPPWERGVDIGEDSNDYIYRTPASQRDRGDDRFERRSFGRDLYDKNRSDRDKDRDSIDSRFSDRKEREESRRGGKYNDRRRGFEKDEEPEWFSGGPTSQNETIELRGFDDSTATTSSVSASTSVATSSTNSSSNNTTANTTTTSVTETVTAARTRPARRAAGSGRTPSAIAANQAKETPNVEELCKEIESMKNKNMIPPVPNAKNDENQMKLLGNETLDKKPTNEDKLKIDSLMDFNMDDIFKLDFLPGLVSNGNVDDGYSGGSRFSRWFKRDSPPVEHENDQSLNDHFINNIINDIDTSISIPNESQHVFAPISPAASTAPVQNSLLEILRRGQQHPQQHSYQHQNKPPVQENIPMKMHSLEELEARMLGSVHQQHQQPQHQQMPKVTHQSQEESAAFKRILAQMNEGRAAPAPNGPIPSSQPMSILQMLSKSQQADQAALEAQHQHHHQNVSHELIKMLHVQNQQQDVNKMMHGNMPQVNRHYQVSPIPNDMHTNMNNLQPPRDLLQRPEAQAIINGLKQGEINPQHLIQQMNNPAIQPRHREVIASILKSYHSQQQNSPRNRLVPPQPQQQQLRISPLPPNAYCVSPVLATSPNALTVHHPAISPRLPTTRELQAHTQSIMQGALIKKKLEEQKENYRRRQEQVAPMLSARTTTPAPIVSPTKHPAALAFTPTSVLRKMTAEKENEHILPKAMGWGAPPLHAQQAPVPKHARPIVKGNTAGVSVPQYQPPQADYSAAQYMSHQQPFANNLQQQQQQQQAAAAAAAARSKMGHQSHHQFHAMVMQMHRQQHQQIQSTPHQLQGNRSGHGSATSNLQQMLIHPHHRNHNENMTNMGPTLSPTSNQLARWFSPELLEQASAGKLPSVNMAMNVLSLEDIERTQHSEAIVHN